MIGIPISDKEWEIIQFMAEKSRIGGVSRIFSDRDERLRKQEINSLVGQIGMLGGSKYMTGSIDLYVRTREEQNKKPYQGDGGVDYIGLNLDIKTSLWKFPSREYHLCVRPAERHPGIVYVHALVSPWTQKPDYVYLTGWLAEEELPERTMETGPLRGAYVVRISQLHPLPPLVWK